MYEMLTIKRLFHRDSDFMTFKAITEEPIPDIRDRRPDVPPGMRTALLQAMARDPAGRFDTAQAFGNAIKLSVAALGGPASTQDLAKLLFTDFGDEMASRDEILKAADDPNAAPVSISVPPPRVPQATPPPVPLLPSRSGEMNPLTPARSKHPTKQTAIPSMIVGQADTARVQTVSPKEIVVDLDSVLDLSADVGADAWMADGGTNLLAAHRWKSLRNTAIAIAIAVVVVVGIVVVFTALGSKASKPMGVAPVADAALKKPIEDLPIDAAPDDHDEIRALSKYGFYSVTANAKTDIYVDDKNIGETPLTHLPLKPGPHTIKAVGPKNKTKIMKIIIIGGRDLDDGSIDW
jgi:hypothetical protein